MSASELVAPGQAPLGTGRLDLHEGIDTPPSTGGCQRWPEHLRLLNRSTGEIVPGRCRATNLCRYCQTLYVVETVEMLTLDAMEHAPTLWVVLTAREHLTRADCRRHLAKLLQAARKRWPGVQWFVQVEFQRRGALHLNLLVKGVPPIDQEAFHDVIVGRWCARVDALPVGQWSGVVEDGVGVVSYISKMLAHGLKAEQRPPIGWRGHRTSQTKGYLVRPASVMREEAKRSLRIKRRIHAGLDGQAAELEEAIRDEWALVQVIDQVADPDRARSRAARRLPSLSETPVEVEIGPMWPGPRIAALLVRWSRRSVGSGSADGVCEVEGDAAPAARPAPAGSGRGSPSLPVPPGVGS